MAKKYNKKKLIADYQTGGYTQRELAHRYNLSVGMVSKITKEISKESEQLVNNKIQVDHELVLQSEQNRNAINEVVNRELKRKLLAEKLEDYLDNAVGQAAKAGVEILQRDEVTMQDVVGFGKFQNDARVGLDLQPKFASSTTNNINAQQNTSIVDELSKLSEKLPD